MKYMKLKTILLIIIVLATMLRCQKKGEDEIFLIPNNYIGPVIVLYDQPGGQSKKYNSAKERIYEIPSSGVLKTKFKFQERRRNIKYRRYNGEKIRYLWPSDEVWKDSIGSKKSKINDSIYAYGAGYSEDYWFIIGNIYDTDSLQNEMKMKWKPYSKSKTLKKGESMGNVKHNKLFDR